MPAPAHDAEAPTPPPPPLAPPLANADVFPWPVLSTREAAGLAGAWAVAFAILTAVAHPTALYFVETDLVGEYLPAARELASGVLNTAHYGYKGPGYPLMVALLSWLCAGDVSLAARLLSPLAGGAAAFAAFLLARRAAGGVAATFTLGALLVTPVFVQHAIEAGTDLPALALMLAASHLVLRPGTWPVRLAAGALAGFAVLTRSNALFLLPCAALVLARGPARLRALTAYAVGAGVPLLTWALVARAAGGLPPDRNYLNIAWELYGRGMPWDQFELTTGPRFHSLWDVFTFQPGTAAARVAGNLVGQRLADVRELLMPWMAVFALPGAVLLAMRREARGWLLHALACALVLAPVFYNPRFALYLLPLQLLACGLALQELARRIRDALHTTPMPRLVPLMAATLVLASAVVAARENSTRLLDAPHEARLAGEALARLGAHGDRIMARKPHVAWYGGLSFVPLPADRPLRELPGWAHAQGVKWLFFSGLEQTHRPIYAVLGDSGVALPGLEPVLWHEAPGNHFYAVYRVTGESADSASFMNAYVAALQRFEQRRGNSAWGRMFAAAQYLDLGLTAEGRARLESLAPTAGADPAVQRLLCTARLRDGDLVGAGDACEQAMRLEPPTAWHWSQLGEIRARQARFDEARVAFTRAVALEPANPAYLELLGRAEIARRDYAAAGLAFDRCVRLEPRNATLRLMAMGAWRLAGDERRVRELYDDGLRAGIEAAALTGGDTPER